MNRFFMLVLLLPCLCMAQDKILVEDQLQPKPALAFRNPVQGEENFVKFDDYQSDADGRKYLIKNLRSDKPEDFESVLKSAVEVVHAVRQNPEVFCKILMTKGSRSAWVLKKVELEPSLAARILIIELP